MFQHWTSIRKLKLTFDMINKEAAAISSLRCEVPGSYTAFYQVFKISGLTVTLLAGRQEHSHIDSSGP